MLIWSWYTMLVAPLVLLRRHFIDTQPR